MYISGQLGLDTQTGSLVPGGVEAEAKKALDNMGHILEAAGISYKNGNFCIKYFVKKICTLISLLLLL